MRLAPSASSHLTSLPSRPSARSHWSTDSTVLHTLFSLLESLLTSLFALAPSKSSFQLAQRAFPWQDSPRLPAERATPFLHSHGTCRNSSYSSPLNAQGGHYVWLAWLTCLRPQWHWELLSSGNHLWIPRSFTGMNIELMLSKYMLRRVTNWLMKSTCASISIFTWLESHIAFFPKTKMKKEKVFFGGTFQNNSLYPPPPPISPRTEAPAFPQAAHGGEREQDLLSVTCHMPSPAQCLPLVTLLNSHDPIMRAASLFPFYRWGSWCCVSCPESVTPQRQCGDMCLALKLSFPTVQHTSEQEKHEEETEINKSDKGKVKADRDHSDNREREW